VEGLSLVLLYWLENVVVGGFTWRSCSSPAAGAGDSVGKLFLIPFFIFISACSAGARRVRVRAVRRQDAPRFDSLAELPAAIRALPPGGACWRSS